MLKNENPWELTPDLFYHNSVYYRFWRRKDSHCEWIYTCTQGVDSTPSPTKGGYASIDALVKTKFGRQY